MPTILKSVDAQITVKSDDAAKSGQFDALVAVFGNVDLQGDVIDKGAFADTLKQYAEAGIPIPILWSHDWDDPESHIGYADASKAQETDEGLLLKDVQLDVEDNARAAQVFKLMEGKRVTQFSFAASTPDVAGAWSLEEGDDGRIVTHLRQLDLIEAGPTLKGANPNTRLVGTKGMRPTLRGGEAAPVVKAGRKLAQKHVDVLASALERVKSATADLTTLLDAVKGDDIDPQTPDASAPGSVPVPAPEDTTKSVRDRARSVLDSLAVR